MIAQKYFAKSNKAFISSGINFADALVAGAYAASENSPLLLSQKDVIPTDVADVLNKNSIKELLLLGGENTILKNLSAK